MFGIDDAALAAMLGGLISTAGSLYANKKNREAEADANAINWEIARTNNATQIEMANTAHQREVRDLRLAGLNPILSAGGNGSSTPTLQSPTLNPVHTDSDMFEGLANSAKGFSRYVGEQYRANLEQLQRTNDALALDNKQQLFELDADRAQLTSDFIQNQIQKIAMMQETGMSVKEKKDGTLEPVLDDWEAARDAVELAREGIRSDLKQRANANWRANLSSFVPFVSPSAVNSAMQFARPYRRRR